MKPETEALLRQCRTALLQQSDENVAALLAYWFETMIGEEHMEEDIDDLCLLLDYRVQSWGAPTVYATYTSWWEVEGYLEPGEGIFTCTDVRSLRLRLLDMSPKQLDLLVELAFQVRSLLAEMDGQSQPATGHEGLRETAAWIAQAAPPTRHVAPSTPPPSFEPAPDPNREQQRLRDKDQARDANQMGYLIISTETNSWVKDIFRHECKVNTRPCLWIELLESQRARLCMDFKTLLKRGRNADSVGPQVQQQISALATPFIVRAAEERYEARFYWATKHRAILDGIDVADAKQAAQELLTRWPTLLKELPPAPLSITRYTPPDPLWKQTLHSLKEQGNTQPPPPLAETIVLPAQWEELLTREQLLAFLHFLDLPARPREIKAPLVQSLQERLNSDATACAQFFEVFAHELSVPPWELETLLSCTTTERKRWVEEDRLPVFDYDSFRKGGSSHDYPLFDRRVVLSTTPSELETWRAEHQAQVKARRSASARAAAAQRKARQSELAPQAADA